MSRLWHLPSQVGKRFGFSFFMETLVSIGARVQEYPYFVAGVTPHSGICGPFDDKFSGAGSMMATVAITPISSGGSTAFVELLEGIALIRQECVSTTLVIVSVFFTTRKLPVLSNPTLQ